jgi:hypothetical protein
MDGFSGSSKSVKTTKLLLPNISPYVPLGMLKMAPFKMHSNALKTLGEG